MLVLQIVTLHYVLIFAKAFIFSLNAVPVTRSKDKQTTLCNEIVPEQVWTMDQVQGIFNVNGVLVDFYL